MKTKSIHSVRAAALAAVVLASQPVQAVNYWFDMNTTTLGFGVADGGSYDWTAADVWGVANDGTGVLATWPDGTNSAYLVGAGAGSYAVRLGADGASNVVLQNVFLNSDGAATPVANGTGDAVIGNPGDPGELQVNLSNSIGTLAGTLTINNPINLGLDRNTNFRGGTVTINGVISGTGSSGVSLQTMTGFTAGTLTLSHPANTYPGPTTIGSGHTLVVPKLADGLSNSSIGASSNAATNLVFNNGILRYTGDTVSTDRNFTLTNATTGSIEVGSAGTVLTLTGGSAATTGALTKLGAGTLQLAGTNLHTGTTTVGQGTLALTAGSPSFAGGLTFGATAGSTAVGALDLTSTSATFGGATLVQTNTTTANTIAIGEGQTLRLNGAVTVGVNTGGSPTTKLSASGLGSFTIGAAGSPTNANVQLGGNTTSTKSNAAILDLSGLSTFYANLGSGTFRVGDITNSSGTSSLASSLILAADSTILATSLSSDSVDTNQNELIRLGSGTNLIQANTVAIGLAGGRSGGTLNFNTTTGTLTLRNLAGTGRAAMSVAYGGSVSGASPTATVNLAGHPVDLLLSTLNIAGRTGTSGNGSTGNFTFDSGTLDVTGVIVGDRRNSITNAGTSTGTLTLNGGTTTIGTTGLTIATSTASYVGCVVNGTVNIGGSAVVTTATGITLGRSATAGIVANAALNITGSSSLTVGGNIAEGLGAGNAAVVSTLTLNGGTLDLAGFGIGSATEPINTLNFQAGTLKNVADINGGAGLIKSVAGALVLDGANPYVGGTIVTAGALSFANTAAQPTNGSIVVAGGAALGLRIGGAGYYSLADVDALFANTFPNVIMNATSGVGIDTTLGDLTYTTTQTGANGLSKLGINTLTLTTAQAYTGATNIYGGSLQLGNGGTVGSLSPSSAIIITNGTLIFNRSNDVTQGADFAALITGAGGSVIQNGTGTLTLNGANTYTGATTIGAGALTATVAGALGSGTSTVIAGTLNLSAGGITNYTGLTAVSGAGTINVTLGTGSNTTSLNGNYSGFTGTLNIGINAAAGAGKVQSNGADNAAATVNVLTHGTLYVSTGVTKNAALVLNGGDLGEALGQLRLESNSFWTGPVTLAGDITGSGDHTIGNNSTNPGTISGIISESGGARALSKGGTGTIILTNANTYTGGTLIGNGVLRLNHDSAAGTGLISIGNAAAATRLTINGGVTLANPISFGNTTGTTGLGVIQQVGTGQSTVTGTITITGVPTAGGHFVGGATDAGNALVLAGPINSTVGISQRQGFVIYSGGGAGYPALTFTDTAIVGAPNGISTAAIIHIGGSASATLDLNGFDQSLAGITKGGFAATIGNSSLLTDSILTTTGTAAFGGVIQDVLGSGTRQVSLTVNGGALTLSGANTYTGVTAVNQGRLAVTGSLGASAVVVGNGATLAGNGNLGGPVTIQSGGHHSLAVAATPEAQVTRTINGALTLDSGTLLDLTAAAGPATGTYVLATATGGIIGTPATITQTGVSGTFSINGNNLEFSVVAPNDFDAWVNYFGLGTADQDPTDDADGDGLNNLIEYVVGSNPSLADAAANTPTGTLVGSNYVFTFKRSDLSETDTTQSVEYGSDLTVWGSYSIGASPGVAPVAIQEDVPDAALDTVTVTIPTGGAPNFFARLKVTR